MWHFPRDTQPACSCVLSSEQGRVQQFTRFGICHPALFFAILSPFFYTNSEDMPHASDVCHLDLLCDRHCSLILSKADHIVSDHSANWVISSHKSSFFRAAGEAGTITASEEEKLRNDCRTALSCAPGKPNTTHYKIGRNRTNCPLRDLPKQMWGFIWQNMPHSSSAVLILGLGNSTEFYRQGWSHHPWGLVSLPVKNAPISANIQ